MKTKTGLRTGAWRSRWAAVGAAVAVTLGAGGMVAVDAAPSDPSLFVSIEPARILDTRTDVGLPGPFVSGVAQKLQVTGTVPTQPPGGAAPVNAEVVPATATSAVFNVTVVGPQTKGFLSIRPGDASGTPATSNINWAAGGANIANAVTVQLPASGTIDIYVNGTVAHVLVDVAGYHIPGGAGVPGPKGDKGDQGDPGPTGPVTMSQGPPDYNNDVINPVSSLELTAAGTVASTDGLVVMPLVGPIETGGDTQTLTSLTYCIGSPTAGSQVNQAEIYSFQPTFAVVVDTTARNSAGCYTVTPNAALLARDSFTFLLNLGGGGTVPLLSVTTTWAPAPPPVMAVESAPGTPSLQNG